MSRKISEVLVQTHFQSKKHEALMGLMVVAGQQIDKQQQFFKLYGITTQQYNLLRILRGQFPNPSTIILLRERMIDKSSDVSRLVERLRQYGFLTRTENATDRRTVDILISERGINLLQTLDAEIRELWQLNDISEMEAEQLVGLLEKIIE